MKSLFGCWRTLAQPLLCATLLVGAGCVGGPDEESISDDGDVGQQNEALTGAGPVKLFQGVDGATGVGLSVAVGGTTKTSTSSKRWWKIDRVTSSESLADSLSLNGTVTAEFALVAEVSGKASFAKSLSTSRYTVSMVVHAVNSKLSTVTDAHLLPGAWASVGNLPGPWVRAYGDYYVSGLERGGELIGAYVFSADTLEEKTALEAGIRAEIDLGLADASVSFRYQMDKVARKANTSWRFYSYVSGLKNPPAITPSNILESVKNFVGRTMDSPVVTGVSVTSYDGLINLSGLQENRDYILGSSPDSPGPMLLTMQKISAQIDELTGIYQFYNWHGDDHNLANARAQLSEDMFTLSTQMNQYRSQPASSLTHYTRSSFKSLAKGFPTLHVTAHHAGPWGNSGGEGFLDYPIGVEGYVKRKTRLHKVRLTLAGGADGSPTGFDLQYADANHPDAILHWDQAHQTNTPWYVHGKGGGDGNSAPTKYPPFVLDSGAFLGWVGVWASKTAVERISLCSQGYCYGGGGKIGSYHELIPPQDSVIMGFQGSAGAWLNSVRIDYFTFHPAVWKKTL